MTQKDKKVKDYLGEGIIIGLLYGIGMFIGAWNRDTKLALLGVIFFVIAFFYHNHNLKKIKEKK